MTVPRFVIAVPLLMSAVAAQRVMAQEHQHPAGEKLGSVHFETSCAPAVSAQFDRAIALLHSFEFGSAIQGFNGVVAADSTCAMAQWGIALARWGNPMVPNQRAAATLEPGRQAAQRAARMKESATPRERAYIDAVGRLYENYETTSQASRVVAYEKAMADVATRYIADTEASIFYAIAMVASAPPTDKTYANQLRAGSMLEAMWARQPDHPGLAHYIIHAYDVPALAPQARAAAERYATIAPSAAHALHMPSHTFTRVGLWNESVATNLKSMEAARRDSSVGEMLHAMDYATYAYLQMRNDTAAKAMVDRLPAIAPTYDVNALRGAATGAAGMYALAAIPARYALERRDWKAAAAIEPRTSAYPHTDAISWFARALGAAHTGDRPRARVALDSLAVLRDRLTSAGEAYWAEQVAIQQLEARAVLYVAEGVPAEALKQMEEAAKREDATEKSAVTPGPIVPAHELFGDLYFDMRRYRDALAHYRDALVKEPGRFRSLYGAMKSAAAIGDRKLQGEFAAQIEKITGSTAWTK
jgi:tetratricopeptide (TPR) repeat protein